MVFAYCSCCSTAFLCDLCIPCKIAPLYMYVGTIYSTNLEFLFAYCAIKRLACATTTVCTVTNAASPTHSGPVSLTFKPHRTAMPLSSNARVWAPCCMLPQSQSHTHTHMHLLSSLSRIELYRPKYTQDSVVIHFTAGCCTIIGGCVVPGSETACHKWCLSQV